MKFLPLIWRNLMRKKLRTAFTLLSILVSFLLFGLLGALQRGFSQGAELAGVNRLIIQHKVSFIQPLPLRYKGVIESVDGVEIVGHTLWFGGYYQDQGNTRFSQFAVDPEAHLAMAPDLALSESEKAAWLANRTGAIISRTIADRHGWERGDRIPLKTPIWQSPPGGWEFTIEGIVEGGGGSSAPSEFLFLYDYLNEVAIEFGTSEGPNSGNWVGQFVVQIDDPERGSAIAGEIDRRFANSSAETKTGTEKAFAQSFANQIGNIGAIALGITSVVFFTLLLITGNTIAQSVRERRSELAVMKAFGFTNAATLGLILAEALVLAVLGGAAGLGLAGFFASGIDLGGLMPPLYVPREHLLTGALLVVAFGLLPAVVPAWQALRLRIVDALRSA